MLLGALKAVLRDGGSSLVRFVLPDGSMVPQYAHVTEVGLVTKEFIDCGGTNRSEAKCVLQTWVADDLDHRLSAAKLLSIIEKAGPRVAREDLSVEVEHDLAYATQFQVESAQVIGHEVVIKLRGRHTACLAPEKCCPPQATSFISLGRKG